MRRHRQHMESINQDAIERGEEPVFRLAGSDNGTSGTESGSGTSNGFAADVDGTERAEDTYELIWRTAGIVGVNPLPLTFRELYWMACGKQEVLWDLTNNLLVQIINAANRISDAITASHGKRPKTRPVIDPMRLNPFRQ